MEVTGWFHNQVSERSEPQALGLFDCLPWTTVLLTPAKDWQLGLDLSFADRSSRAAS